MVSPETDRHRWSWLRPLLVRVVIDTLTLLGAILLFSLIRLPERNADGRYVFDVPVVDLSGAVPVDLLLLGASLALVSTFVRPVLAALTGLAIVRTFGLSVVIVRAIVFLLAMWLAIEISGMEVVVADPRLLWMAAIAVVLSLLLFAVETLLGFNRPRLEDVGARQPLWQLGGPPSGPPSQSTPGERPPGRGPGDRSSSTAWTSPYPGRRWCASAGSRTD